MEKVELVLEEKLELEFNGCCSVFDLREKGSSRARAACSLMGRR